MKANTHSGPPSKCFILGSGQWASVPKVGVKFPWALCGGRVLGYPQGVYAKLLKL